MDSLDDDVLAKMLAEMGSAAAVRLGEALHCHEDVFEAVCQCKGWTEPAERTWRRLGAPARPSRVRRELGARRVGDEPRAARKSLHVPRAVAVHASGCFGNVAVVAARCPPSYRAAPSWAHAELQPMIGG